MHYSCAIHKPFATRSQLLILSTLATALLFETRGLVDDLSMAEAKASVRVRMSAMTLGGRMQPGLYDQWPTRSVSVPIEIEPDPNSVILNNPDPTGLQVLKKCRVSGRRHFCHPTSFQRRGCENGRSTEDPASGS